MLPYAKFVALLGRYFSRKKSHSFLKVPTSLLGVLIILSTCFFPGQIVAQSEKTFIIPVAEEELLDIWEAMVAGAGNNSEVNIGITITGFRGRIYYDHWEDGYETDPANPIQSSTEVWGDDNAANGTPPGLSSDILTDGDFILLSNTVFANPRDAANIFYDGKDKIYSNRELSITKGGWPTDRGTWQGVAVDVPPISEWGNMYEAPVGIDINSVSMFEYTSWMIIASEDNTEVQIDANADGVMETTVFLDQGEYHVENDNINVNAMAIADKPILVTQVSGPTTVLSGAENRWFNLVPYANFDSDYILPVGYVSGANFTNAWIHNPGNSTITINWQNRTTSGSFTVPANSAVKHEITSNTGTRFTEASGNLFQAIMTYDSDTYIHDWGITIRPFSKLTSTISAGWAPGSSTLAENSSPLWVTASAATTLYVDYDGNISTGALTDSKGYKYDVSYSVSMLQAIQIEDNSDNDQSQTRIYTLDGTLITGAWGQYANGASVGSPALDMGTPVLPSIFVLDSDRDGLSDINDLDDDNDGITDMVEVCGDGATSFVCANNPGGGDPVKDDDGDGFLNYEDPDYCTLNANGVCDNLDTDGDGIIDLLDLDSDNDNCYDVLESGGTDNDNNGIIDDFEDTNDNGLTDEFDPLVGGTALILEDFNNNGSYDFQDPVTLAPPVAVNNFATTEGTNPVVIEVLANDFSCGSLINYNTLTNDGFISPSNGSLTIDNVAGEITYTANVDFVGLDTFEYQVCDVLEQCDVALVIVNVICPGTAGLNIISGKVIDDANGNGLDDDSGTNPSGITITIYQDNNADGQVDGGDTELTTVTTDGNGDFSHTITTSSSSVTDAFDGNYPSGGTGWNSDWTTIGTIPSPTSPAIDIEDNQEIYRTLDLSNARTAELSFNYWGDSDNDNGQDYIVVEVCSDNSFASCQTFVHANLTNSTTNSVSNVTIDEDKMNENTVIRLRAIGVSGRSEHMYIDNIVVDYTLSAIGTYVMEIQDSDIPAGYMESTGNIETAVFTAISQTDCRNLFGLFLIPTDHDGDGIDDVDDLDDDNDGIPDYVEVCGPGATSFVCAGNPGGEDPAADADNDDTPNSHDPDYCTLNAKGVCANLDKDGDGIIDMYDLDADNDGIPDIIESGGVDNDGDGRIDNLNGDGTLINDVDGDGWADTFDYLEGSVTSGNTLPVSDLDGDGWGDYLDIDSDNDGIPDLIEAGGTDFNGNGRVDSNIDLDGDGLADIYDSDAADGPSTIGVNGSALIQTSGTDTGSDGIADNDNAISYVSGNSSALPDFDGDGIPNHKDLDSDGDGILDIIEAGGPDTNRDGMVDVTTDMDGDGLADSYDPNASDGPEGSGTDGTPFFSSDVDGGDLDSRLEFTDLLGTGDFDGDDVPNFLDVDSDNDGIFDSYESQASIGYTPPSGSDDDRDGIDNAYDDDHVNFGGAGSAGTTPVNTDSGSGDTNPDYLDTDSDGDGVPDMQEAWDSMDDGDSRPDGATYSECFVDTDGDGLVDCFDNDDAGMTDWRIILSPPNDDGTGGTTISLGVDVDASNDVDDIFPNNADGSSVTEPDWRDAGNAECATAATLYAMTDGGTTYEWNSVSQKHEPAIRTGVVRATALCAPTGGWYRFYNPLEPENYLFAIQNGTNTTDLTTVIDYIEIEIEAAPVLEEGPDHAFLVMARSWNVVTKSDLNGSVNIRFYFTPTEYSEFSTGASNLGGRYSDGLENTEWFKVTNGLDYEDLPYDPSLWVGNYLNMNPNVLGKDDGQEDSDLGGNNKNYIQFDGLTSFSGGTLGADAAGTTLPVEWLSFSIEQKESAGILNWMTSSELNANYFGIERSIDGNVFQEIGQKSANGTTTEISEYNFIDKELGNLPVGKVFYRLRQVDLNGDFSYSKVLELSIVNSQPEIWVNVMPTLVNDWLTVQYKLNETPRAQLEIITNLGQRMYFKSLTDPVGDLRVITRDWANGIYFVRLTGYNSKEVIKIKVQH